jgi:hypothetical protein
MNDLFLSECRRFRTHVLVAAAVHLVLQLLAARITDPLQQQWQPQTLFLVMAGVCGLAFAVVQFNTHRQPSRWLWLMHRPLPRWRIFGALSAASTALLVFAIGLPALLAVLGADYTTGRTVDLRHYLIPLHLSLTALVAWLAGSYLMLCGRKSAFVVLFVPGVLTCHLAAGGPLLVPVLLCVAMMGALAYTAFAPDRSAPPARPAGLVAAGIPLVLGCYIVMLWGGSVAFQGGQMLLGVSPINRPLPPAGGYTELIRTDGAASLRRALAASKDPRAVHWGRQLALLDVGKIKPEGHEHPVRGAIANLERTGFGDPTRNILWTFNHDRMLYEGRDGHTDAPRGWLGAGGLGDLQPFGSVPVMADKYLLTRQQLLQLDPDSFRMRALVTLKAPETLTGALQEVGRQQFVLTNRRLIALRRPIDPAAPLEQVYSVLLPGPFGDLDRVDVARLLDGTLLSFNFGRRMVKGETGSRQHLLFVDAAGRAHSIAVRALAHDFPVLFEHADWWLSPVIHAVLSLPERLLDKGLIADAPGTAAQSRPQAVVAAALLAALLAAAFAAWRLRAAPLSRRLAWIAAALVLGPPAAAALCLLAPRSAVTRVKTAASAPVQASLPAAA